MSDVESWAGQVAEIVRRELYERTRPPEVTYRVQFHPGHFTFPDATAVVPYLNQLGVSHLYASPYLMARPGSEHGYDVIDHHRLNSELGTADEYKRLVARLHEHGMGQILDIVPNHMGVATGDNRWWNDVLENGPSSPYAHFFDIDWHPVKPELRNKLLLPMLGEQYGQVLESGQLQLKQQGGRFLLHYYDLTLPIEPKSYSILLSHRFEELESRLGSTSEPLIELRSILTALDYLPPYTRVDEASAAERQREKEVIKGRLETLIGDCPEIAEFLRQNVAEFNGDPSDPASFDRLDGLLEGQVYRLCHWKAASDEINYRRFFDINELAALCMEEPDVFEETHRLVLELLAGGAIDGLRIDHIDGLFDPEEYLWRLQWAYLRVLGRAAYSRLCKEPESSIRQLQTVVSATGESVSVPEAAALRAVPEQSPSSALRDGSKSEQPQPSWRDVEPTFVKLLYRDVGGPADARLYPTLFSCTSPLVDAAARLDGDARSGEAARSESGTWSRRGLPLYVVVEKILEANEDLPANWPVAGTSGYEFLNTAAGLFVDVTGARQMEKRYQRFTGQKKNLHDVVYRCKRLIINVAMAAELQLLAVRISRLSEQHRRFRDFTLRNLRSALQEIIACFPVYRTYITAESSTGISQRDREFIAVAVRQARRRNPTLDVRVFEFVRDVLLLDQPPDLDQKSLRARRFFVGRFQQVTSPVMAKGVEDTAFYRYFPLSSLNEVGGGFHAISSVENFHSENAARRRHRGGSLLCSTSHDTKRSEDVRARISVLSEIPNDWRAALSEWSRLNRRHRSEIDGEPAPSRNDEYLFYQTLVGIWPLSPPSRSEREQLTERIQGYMQKATHEAKMCTSWVNPDPDYDEAVRRFVRGALEESSNNRFLSSFTAFHERVVDWGLSAALSQLVLKLTVPGVPDIYQGQETWDFSLVDPDNRRPVDYEYRSRLLAELQRDLEGGPDALLALARRLAARPRDDRLKLFVTWRSLRFRRLQATLFQNGRYVPLSAAGSRADHVVAFAWLHESAENGAGCAALVAVPRLMAKLAPNGNPYGSAGFDAADIWQDTTIQMDETRLPSLVRTKGTDGTLARSVPAPLKNLFTGRTMPLTRPTFGPFPAVPVADLFADFPLAVLCSPDWDAPDNSAEGSRKPETTSEEG